MDEPDSTRPAVPEQLDLNVYGGIPGEHNVRRVGGNKLPQIAGVLAVSYQSPDRRVFSEPPGKRYWKNQEPV